MDWKTVNGSLIMAAGRGFSFSVRKLSSGEYLVNKDSYTNGSDQSTVKTQAEGIRLAESWNNAR